MPTEGLTSFFFVSLNYYINTGIVLQNKESGESFADRTFKIHT